MTERPSLDQAALKLRATPQPIFKYRHLDQALDLGL
jgi:hypothetical protein